MLIGVAISGGDYLEQPLLIPRPIIGGMRRALAG